MKNEKDILKWFNNEMSSQEIDDLKRNDNLETLDKVNYYASQLKAPIMDVEQALKEFQANKSSKKEVKVRTLNFSTFYKVAAILVVTLSCSYFLFFNNLKSFETSIAQTETFSLPDNSEVILNAQSKLTYNKKTWKNDRTLNLDGEAFFKVSKGQKFSVHTDAGVVQVLGTQFNVKERNNYFEVKCFEGLVSVSYEDKNIKLTPGKTFRVINGKPVSVDDFKSTSPTWIKNESEFVNVPLEQVIAELERQYNLKISAPNVDTSQFFTGTFTHTNKIIALKSITIPLKLNYKLDGNNVVFFLYEDK